jgi:hypothetical protein
MYRRRPLAQFASLLIGYYSGDWFYVGSWLVIIAISVPLFLISVALLMNSRTTLVWRLILSFWALSIPLAREGYRRAADAPATGARRAETVTAGAACASRRESAFDVGRGAPWRESCGGGRRIRNSVAADS